MTEMAAKAELTGSRAACRSSYITARASGLGLRARARLLVSSTSNPCLRLHRASTTCRTALLSFSGQLNACPLRMVQRPMRSFGRSRAQTAVRFSLASVSGSEEPEKPNIRSVAEILKRAREEALEVVQDLKLEAADIKNEADNWWKSGKWKDPRNWDWRWFAAGLLWLALLQLGIRSALGLVARPPWSPLLLGPKKATIDKYMEAVVPEPTELNRKLVLREAWKQKYPTDFEVKRLETTKDGMQQPVETGFREGRADEVLKQELASKGAELWETPDTSQPNEPVAVVEGVELMSVEVWPVQEAPSSAGYQLDAVPQGVKGGTRLTSNLVEAAKARFANRIHSQLGSALEHPVELTIKLKGGEMVTLRDSDRIEAYRNGQTFLATTNQGQDVVVFNSPREAGVRNLSRAKHLNQAALRVLSQATNEELRLALDVASRIREKATADQVEEAATVWQQWQEWVVHADAVLPAGQPGISGLQQELESARQSLTEHADKSGPILKELKQVLRERVEVLERSLPRQDADMQQMEERIGLAEESIGGAEVVGLKGQLEGMRQKKLEDAVEKQHLEEMLRAETPQEVVDVALREVSALESLIPQSLEQRVETFKAQLQDLLHKYTSGRRSAQGTGPSRLTKLELPVPTTAEGWQQRASELEGAAAELRTKALADLEAMSKGLEGWKRAADHVLQEWGSLKEEVPAWEKRANKWQWLLAKDIVTDARQAMKSTHLAQFDLEKLRDEAVQESVAAEAPLATPALAEQVQRTWWKFRPEMPYVDFLRYVAHAEVESAVFNADFNKLYVTMKAGFPSEFVVNAPADPYLPGYLTANQVQVDTIGWSYWASAWRVTVWFARVFGAALVVYSAIKAFPILTAVDSIQLGPTWPLYDPMNGANKEFLLESLKMPKEVASIPMSARMDANAMTRWRRRLNVGKEKTRMDIEFTDIGGMTPILESLYEVLEMYADPAKYISRGAKLPRTILLSGPPGTGKTMLARALANESQMPFFFVAGSDFVDVIGGSQELKEGKGSGWRMHDLFMAARMNAPSIIFFDEIDALAAEVKEPGEAEREAKKDVMGVFFEEMEAAWYEWQQNHLCEQILVIMATNRPEALMPRMRRPDFLDHEIHIPLPDAATRCEIFNIHRKEKQMAPDVDFSKLVHRTVGWNGADIRNLINEAGILAIRRDRGVIKQEDLVGVLDKLVMEEMDFTFTEEELAEAEDTIAPKTKWMVSLHHSAKVLLAMLWPRYDTLAATGVCTGKQLNSWSSWYPREELLLKGAPTVGYLKMQMVNELGARCAERLLLGEEKLTDATADDLKEVAALARRLVEAGASPRTGLYPLTKYRPPSQGWRSDPLENIYQSGLSGPIVNMSKEVGDLFTRDIDRYIRECEEVAMEALRANKQLLLDLTEEFLKHDKLAGEEVEAFIKARNPIYLPDWFVGIEKVELKPGAFTEGIQRNASQEVLDTNWRRFRYYNLDIYPAPLHRG